MKGQSTIPATASPRLAVIRRALESVTDPEIPVLNVVDMGIIIDVRLDHEGVVIDMTPTFVGCPALEVIRDNIKSTVMAAGEPQVSVRVVYDPPWTSERISEEDGRKLKEFGLAPPMAGGVIALTLPSPEGRGVSGGVPWSSAAPPCTSDNPHGGAPADGGLAMPPSVMECVPCPFCGSSHTEMESLFGPTLCRSIHYCHDCLQSFEHFKTV